MTSRCLVLTALCLTLAWAGGCGDDNDMDDGGGDADGMDGGPVDGGGEGGVVDGGRPCTVDEDCSDGVDCTRDICDERMLCRNPTDFAMCDDGTFCNGVEQCHPIRGCEPGPLETCNDEDVCTIDICDEPMKICLHGPRDFDEDGEADWHCEGGTDCDDRDPRRRSTSAEVCGDTIDNDCDEMVDETMCGRPPHDVCMDALDVSAGGAFLVATDGAVADYSLTCGGGGSRDVVLTFTLTETKDVRVEADGESLTWVALRESCEDRLTEFECASGFPGTVSARSLEPGTYFIVIADLAGGELEVLVEFDDPTPPPMNETCASPLAITPGRYTGSTIDVSDDITTVCSGGPAPDLVYSFTTTARQNVSINLVATTGDTMNFAVRSACMDEASQVRCARGAPAGSTLYDLPAGTWFLIVEGPSFREVDFTLDLAFLDPTPAPAGDTCATAIPLTLDTPTVGTLADKEDDLALSCSFFNRDAVYSFTIASRSDVTVSVDGAGSFMFVSVRPTCTNETGMLRCTSGAPARARIRDLPAGTYYVIVESFRSTGFTIEVEAAPPTPPTMVTGNENCATAHVVPATGGLFSGNTTTMMNDYETATCGSGARSNDAVFRVDLSSTRHVIASTEGSSFDTVLHMHNGSCSSMAETACDDDSGDGSTSVIDRMLGAGTYFFVVDGFGSTSVGNYFFEVMITP